MSHNKLTDAQRFFSKLEVDEETGCWNWIGALNSKGYGSFFFRGTIWLASRVSYIMSYGDFEKSYFVLHRCDNPRCVNPKHLFLGTSSDNAIDREAKGRGNQKTGEDAHAARLTWKKARKIRALRKKGISQRKVAKIIGVGATTVGRVEHNKLWVERGVE